MIKIKKQNSQFCPVLAMWRFLEFRGFQEGSLFCQVDGLPVSYHWYRKHFAEIITFANLDENLTTHSARIGAATFAAASGFLEEDIKRMGRWASSAVKKYIKMPILCF